MWAAAPGPELGERVDVLIEVKALQECCVPVFGVVVVGARAAPFEGRVPKVGERRANGVIERCRALVDVQLCLELTASVRGAVFVDAVGHDPHPIGPGGS